MFRKTQTNLDSTVILKHYQTHLSMIISQSHLPQCCLYYFQICQKNVHATIFSTHGSNNKNLQFNQMLKQLLFQLHS